MSCNISVAVGGEDVSYCCAVGRTVGWAIDHIRERYVITGGSIDCNGVGTDAADIIQSGNVYNFVGGILGKINFKFSFLHINNFVLYDFKCRVSILISTSFDHCIAHQSNCFYYSAVHIL